MRVESPEIFRAALGGDKAGWTKARFAREIGISPGQYQYLVEKACNPSSFTSIRMIDIMVENKVMTESEALAHVRKDVVEWRTAPASPRPTRRSSNTEQARGSNKTRK